jgi:aarF domain-containing kinase
LYSLPAMRQASTSSPTLPVRSRSVKWLRRGGIVAGFGLTVYVVDKQFNASAITRSLRTAYIGYVRALQARGLG